MPPGQNLNNFCGFISNIHKLKKRVKEYNEFYVGKI